MKKILKLPTLFMIGGLGYYLLEVGVRGFSHPPMFFIGGLCFVLVGVLDEGKSGCDLPIWKQGILGSGIITGVELASGFMLNKWLGLYLWDYSHIPLNFEGQVCLLFSVFWIVLSMVVVILDDLLRYLIFGEKMPKYRML